MERILNVCFSRQWMSQLLTAMTFRRAISKFKSKACTFSVSTRSCYDWYSDEAWNTEKMKLQPNVYISAVEPLLRKCQSAAATRWLLAERNFRHTVCVGILISSPCREDETLYNRSKFNIALYFHFNAWSFFIISTRDVFCENEGAEIILEYRTNFSKLKKNPRYRLHSQICRTPRRMLDFNLSDRSSLERLVSDAFPSEQPENCPFSNRIR